MHAVGGGEALNSYHYIGGNLLQARDPLGLEGGYDMQSLRERAVENQQVPVPEAKHTGAALERIHALQAVAEAFRPLLERHAALQAAAEHTAIMYNTLRTPPRPGIQGSVPIAYDADRGWYSTVAPITSSNPFVNEIYASALRRRGAQHQGMRIGGGTAIVAATAVASGGATLLRSSISSSSDDISAGLVGAILSRARSSLGLTSARSQSRNLGMLLGEVDGEAVSMSALSGHANPTGTVAGVSSSSLAQDARVAGSYLRDVDAEVKLLTNLEARLTAQSTGDLVLLTERPMCGSCSHVVNQFRARYPNVRVTVHAPENQGTLVGPYDTD